MIANVRVVIAIMMIIAVKVFASVLVGEPVFYKYRGPDWVLIGLLILQGAALAVMFLHTIFGYRGPWSKVLSVEDFYRRAVDEGTEYCLILRPFGADGYIYLASPHPLTGWRRSLTVEQVIAAVVQSASDLATVPSRPIATVSIAAPGLSLLPPGPTFLRVAEGSWKRDVDRLLRRALIVIVLLPPGRSYSSGIAWEVKRALAAGLLGRVAIVLPPKQMFGAHASRAALVEDGTGKQMATGAHDDV